MQIKNKINKVYLYSKIDNVKESYVIFQLIKFIFTGKNEKKIKAVRYIRDLAYLYEEEYLNYFHIENIIMKIEC